MSGLFSSPKAPEPKPIIDHASYRAAGDAERRRRAAAGGLASTMLTSAGGLGNATIGTTTLLGQ